jgi:hypothetical protein
MIERRKLESPLKIDLSFGEALSRFVATTPKEVEISIKKSKAKKPPQDEPPRRPERPKRRALKRP